MIVGIFSALARVFYHLQRFWSPAQAAAPRTQPASLRPCFSSIYGARPPQLPLKSALPGSVSGSRRQPRPAGAEPAAGPERQAPLGAPELGGGVREPPEEDGLRTQQAELLQTPQKGKGRRRRSLSSEGKEGAEPLRLRGPSAPRVPSGRPGMPDGEQLEAGAEGGGEDSAGRRSLPHGPGLSRAGQPSLQTRPQGRGRAADSGWRAGEMPSAYGRCPFPSVWGCSLCGRGHVT